MDELTPEEFLAKVLEPEYESDHICWDCRYLKPVIKGSKFPPADIIGWCKKIHWPDYWCVADFNVVKKCYAFEATKAASPGNETPIPPPKKERP